MEADNPPTGSFARYPSLAGRVVLITGGAAGIGAAMVEQFALQHSKVAFLDIDERSAGGLLQQLDGRCRFAPLFVPCDLTDPPAIAAAIGQIEQSLGVVRVLVNNAANDARHQFAGVTPEFWDAQIAANLKHQFFVSQAVISGMAAAGGGSIINMSSISWQIGARDLSIYDAAKAAIVGLTRALAREFGPAGIRVNSVQPGWIWTERQRELWLTPETEADLMRLQCLKRLLDPVEVARLVLFLAADDSSAITNQTHIVDGGWI